MSGILLLEQSLNGLQFGLMLFLLAAGLTLVFGIMDMINLAHGSLYMIGAYLIANEAVRIVWGPQPLLLNAPAGLTGPVQLPGGMQYASYRLAIIIVGAAVAVLLYLLVTKTRVGMLVRAGASNREMAVAMGVNIRRLFTVVFALGAAVLFFRPQGLFPARG